MQIPSTDCCWEEWAHPDIVLNIIQSGDAWFSSDSNKSCKLLSSCPAVKPSVAPLCLTLWTGSSLLHPTELITLLPFLRRDKEKKPKAPRTLITAGGRVLNVNEPKYTYTHVLSKRFGCVVCKVAHLQSSPGPLGIKPKEPFLMTWKGRA